jgi:hypothetical protein
MREERRTSRHIQEVKLMLPKMPERANVTGNACAAAAIEVEASSGIVVVSQGVEECKIEKQNENENENETE